MNRPPIIYFTGLDGSGKTTFVNMLAEELRSKGWPIKVVWLRMSHYLSKPLLLFCRISGLTEYEDIEGVRVSYHHFYRSRIVSWLYILLRGTDTFFDALTRVYIPARIFGKTVICDRYVFDALIDLMVDTHRFKLWNGLVAKFFRILVPRGSIPIMIIRDELKIRECRPELRCSATFAVRARLYDELACHFPHLCIHNDRSPEAGFAELSKKIGFLDEVSC